MNRQMRRLQAKEEARAKKQEQPTKRKERTGVLQFLACVVFRRRSEPGSSSPTSSDGRTMGAPPCVVLLQGTLHILVSGPEPAGGV